MLKVFGFVKGNQRLSHDEYRAAHAGYHNSYGRRLNNIRGYLLNVKSNRQIQDLFGGDFPELYAGKSSFFEGCWSGYGQLMFDSLEDYLNAKSPARDKPTENGLELDETVASVGGDAPYLYSGPPIQFHVQESVLEKVKRPEYKIFKVVHFAKRASHLTMEEFRSLWSGRYGALLRARSGVLGAIVNFPTDLDVVSGFFSEDSGAFHSDNIRTRNSFLSEFDGMGEYWFRSPDDFSSWRKSVAPIARSIESEIFDSFFYQEVDEGVAVLPDRLPRPAFYHR